MRKVLLVVDDEACVRLLLEHYLGEEYSVIAKEDGQEAFDWLAEGNTPDMVLADIEMPNIDGYELLIRMRNNALLQDVPYLIVSGKDKQNNYVKSFKLGASDFISKPFSPHELNEKVHRYLV